MGMRIKAILFESRSIYYFFATLQYPSIADLAIKVPKNQFEDSPVHQLVQRSSLCHLHKTDADYHRATILYNAMFTFHNITRWRRQNSIYTSVRLGGKSAFL